VRILDVQMISLRGPAAILEKTIAIWDHTFSTGQRLPFHRPNAWMIE
jgi:hypothetical protein